MFKALWLTLETTVYRHNIHPVVAQHIQSWKSPLPDKKSQNVVFHPSVCLLVRTEIWDSPSHRVDQWVVRARLILINRPIYNSSVWDSSSSLHLSPSLGHDSCLTGIHSLQGRAAAIRLLTACLGFPALVTRSVLPVLFFLVCCL